MEWTFSRFRNIYASSTEYYEKPIIWIPPIDLWMEYWSIATLVCRMENSRWRNGYIWFGRATYDMANNVYYTSHAVLLVEIYYCILYHQQSYLIQYIIIWKGKTMYVKKIKNQTCKYIHLDKKMIKYNSRFIILQYLKK